MSSVDAKHLTIALGGRWHGRFGLAFCPAHANTRTPALTLSNGRDGRLLAKCHAGCTFAEIASALRERGLLGDDVPAVDPELLARREAEAEREAGKNRALAWTLWDAATPVEGTLAEAYLRARAIRPPWPPSLRFHPGAYCAEARGTLPAMLAAVNRGGKFVAVHRTYLSEPGRKAPLAQPRMMLARAKGGAVRLTGPSPILIVAEGIETALSLRDGLAAKGVEVWAGLSTSGVAAAEFPEHVARVIAAPDNDASGRRAAAELGERCAVLGIDFGVMDPPDGISDWNDWAQRMAA